MDSVEPQPVRTPEFVSALFVLLALAVGCGARTGLGLGNATEVADAAVEPQDAAPDAVRPRGCPQGATRVFVITEEYTLYAFDPSTSTFEWVGDIQCPGATARPWSMAVARDGTAYSVFEDGTLWKLDTTTARCDPTPFVPGQNGFLTFGMGYSGDARSDTLYVAQADFGLASRGLGTIDTDSYVLSFVGEFQPPLTRCELTGTSDRRLFAFCLNALGSTLSEVDPSTARVLRSESLAVGEQSDGFAFAFWGGDFWIFTGPVTSTVTRYDPRTHAETTVASLGSSIVGAGVSTCAPTSQ